MSEDLAAICINTQDTLGKIIDTPDLKKHLKQLEKPPYRFLHDIFTGFVKTTKFWDGYFTEEEMNGGRETDKAKKLAFLQKAIDITSATLGKSVSAKPSKIVAGVEPERTNEWLQALAKCHTDGKDWKAAIKKLESKKADKDDKHDDTKESKDKEPSKHRSSSERKSKETVEKERHEGKESGSSKDRHNKDGEGGSKSRHKDDVAKEARDPDRKKSESERKSSDRKDDDKKRDSDKKDERKPDRDKREPSSSSSKKGDDKSPEVPKLPLGEDGKSEKKKHSSEKRDDKKEPPKEAQPERPSTARKPPPVIKSNVVATDAPAVATEKKRDDSRAANVIVDKKKVAGKGNDSESEDEAELAPPFEQTGGHEQSMTDGGAGGGYLSNLGQQDRSAPASSSNPSIERQNSGTGIVLARRTKGNQKQSLDVEVGKLRESLQTLTKSTNPLGKAMEYVQEDLDSMQRELELWRNETKQQAQAWQDQQRQTQDMLAPLFAQKCDLEDSINDQIDKLNSTKASILRADAHIENLLRMVVTSANYAGRG